MGSSRSAHGRSAAQSAFGQQEAAKEAALADEPPRRSLFKARSVPKQKVIF
jgi:hypothetical protein